MTQRPNSFQLESARAALCWSSRVHNGVTSQKPPAQNGTIACGRVAQNPLPCTPGPLPLSLLLLLEVSEGGFGTSATTAAALTLPGVSVEVVLLGGCTGCFGSYLPHPEARQKGFLGKQKETKYHMVSPPWGHIGDISQYQEKPVFL